MTKYCLIASCLLLAACSEATSSSGYGTGPVIQSSIQISGPGSVLVECELASNFEGFCNKHGIINQGKWNEMEGIIAFPQKRYICEYMQTSLDLKCDKYHVIRTIIQVVHRQSEGTEQNVNMLIFEMAPNT